MTVASAALLLFLILDPLGNIPVFLSLLKNLKPSRQRAVIVRELLIALGVLMLFLWGGQYALELMHLKQESVSIAGGIVLFLIGLRMIFPPPEGIMGEIPDGEPFIVPMAIPMIAGPGSIASAMLLMARSDGLSESVLVLAALIATLLLTLVALLAAGPLMRLLGHKLEAMITRILGVILAALAAQFVIDGIEASLT